jgi:hypothetical protein
MGRKISLAVVLLASLTASAAVAADKFDPEARARQLAPFVDRWTIGVGHFDLQRLDVKAYFAQVRKLGIVEDWQIPRPQAAWQAWVDAFREAGGADLFVVINFDDFPEASLWAYRPLIVVPLKPGANTEKLVEILWRKQGFASSTEFPGVLLVGDRDVLLRVSRMKAAARPEIAQAFAAAGDSPAQVLFLPTPFNYRLLGQLAPQLPHEIGGQPSARLLEGMSWAALRIDLPPQPGLKLIVQSLNAKAAKEFQKAVTNGLSRPLQDTEAQAVPNLLQITKLLTPQVKEDRVDLTLDTENGGAEKLIEALLPALAQARERDNQAQARRNLKWIGLTLHNYHDTYSHFPAAAVRNAQNQPLLSWRVLMLPYLDQGPLYNEFRRDEPWDSPHNSKLIERMPEVYHAPKSKLDIATGKTTYLGVGGKTGVFGGEKGLQIGDITDGTMNTLMVVDVADEQAVIWTKPADWEPDPKDILKGLVGHDPAGFHALFGELVVRTLPKDIDLKTLLGLISYNGGEVVVLPEN